MSPHLLVWVAALMMQSALLGRAMYAVRVAGRGRCGGGVLPPLPAAAAAVVMIGRWRCRLPLLLLLFPAQGSSSLLQHTS
jgi:hypothetical protein